MCPISKSDRKHPSNLAGERAIRWKQEARKWKAHQGKQLVRMMQHCQGDKSDNTAFGFRVLQNDLTAAARLTLVMSDPCGRLLLGTQTQWALCTLLLLRNKASKQGNKLHLCSRRWSANLTQCTVWLTRHMWRFGLCRQLTLIFGAALQMYHQELQSTFDGARVQISLRLRWLAALKKVDVLHWHRKALGIPEL